jgi:Immunity protein 49
MDKIFQFKDLYENILKQEKFTVERIAQYPNFVRGDANSLWGDNERLALYEWFAHKDSVKVKQHFYKCGRLLEYLTQKWDVPILSYGRSHVSYLLLSDQMDLIKRFADFTYQSTPANRSHQMGIEGGHGNTFHYLIQCIIKEDWTEWERVLVIVKTKSVKRYRMDLDVAFLENLVLGNQAQMEALLRDLLKPAVHKRRNIMPFINEFISEPALGYAKLAWYKGIEVTVDSPLVPKEWLPIQPLEADKYVDYDFVKAALK